MLKHLRLKRPLCALDLETTGTHPDRDRVVEVAVLRLDPRKEPVTFLRRVNAEIPIPPTAAAVHGITDDDVADRPPFRAIARRLARLLGGCDLAGFGIRRFDLPFLRAEFARAGMVFRLKDRAVVDALDIFHQREPRDLASALRFYCGRGNNAHRAASDVRAAVAVLDVQLARYRDLPRTVAERHRRTVGVDVGGWFRREGGRIVFAVGKHQGRPLAEVAHDAPDYLRWMLHQHLLGDARALVQWALQAVGG
jgi:DNA polymerase-3 subunit epsilon